ncbi:hypothetical protein TRAPUB_8751 [Trametes pubescens]|uniref:Protein kinase domain-containing protein n=1 Tax=Trametes pubescens TaxID=154538 RepID=A0A1M2W4C1_TRAPU|nr:hypothetical protein TRAPUB_8751 [Trametes pubescens]
MVPPPQPPQEATDIFSISDQVLADRLQFIEEVSIRSQVPSWGSSTDRVLFAQIGFGNWGSVWLCRPKSSTEHIHETKIAVKLVHRSKTSTTAARVRSLYASFSLLSTIYVLTRETRSQME